MKEQEETSKENPFKGLESNHKPPDHIKEKVMSSVNFSNLLADVTELFTSNMASSVTGLFKIKPQNDESDSKPEEKLGSE